MPDSAQGESTRDKLIAAGLHLFGRKGFAATSTREIAARAGTNVASIAYHFGGKDGLRMACAEDSRRARRAASLGRRRGRAMRLTPEAARRGWRRMRARRWRSSCVPRPRPRTSPPSCCAR